MVAKVTFNYNSCCRNNLQILKTIALIIQQPSPISLATATANETSIQLIVEPVKVVDEASKLLVFYPARTDLVNTPDAIEVMRPS